MGCDIHASIEYSFRPDAVDFYDWDEETVDWFTWCDFGLNLGRSYDWFAALAGVRRNKVDPAPLFPPRGFPRSNLHEARYNEYNHIRYHSHSYLSYHEILMALQHFGLSPEMVPLNFGAAIAAMGVLNKDFDTRLVFCFDS